MPTVRVPFILLLALFALNAAGAADFYVAPNGDDTGPGTLAKPFASLQRARDAVRKARVKATSFAKTTSATCATTMFPA